MKYRVLSTLCHGVAHFTMECSACGQRLDDVERNKQKYCPKCGHKLQALTPNVTSSAVTELMNLSIVRKDEVE